MQNLPRCAWVNLSNQLYINYHDQQWGVPVYDDQTLFEMLILEGAQAGLSWETILKRRESYRQIFDNFDVQKVANYSDQELNQKLENSKIIRNRLKVYSTRKNAQIFQKIQLKYGSFSNYLWAFVDNKPIINHPQNLSDIAVKTELSNKISRDLKKQGMSFVGSTIIYAYLQAVGVINDHTQDCFLSTKPN
jgi:DNA-3-methyladenine glycosylase I